MKDKMKLHVSRERRNIDFSNPDLQEISQIFSDTFGGPFAVEKQELPEGYVSCRPCEGTGRVIQIKKRLLGTVKNVTQTPCPHCQGKGYVPKEEQG